MQEIITYWGKELLSTWIILPIVWYLLREQKRLQDEYLNSIKKWFKDLELSIWRQVPPSNESIIELASKFVWSAWSLKLDYIRQRLEKNNLADRKERIKAQINAELTRISYEEYIKPLNKYNTKVWLLWDWVSNNFPMEDFLEEIYDVVFNEDKNIDRKLSDISTVMKSYQNELWQELKNLLNN